MSSKIFLIFGYGVPKNILKDENYSMYLKLALNHIFSITQKLKQEKNILIVSGGKTDCFKPYHRTEAGEMARWIKSFFIGKPYLSAFSRTIRVLREDRSLSTLENFLCTKKVIAQKNISGDIVIFCEALREKRITTLAKRVWGTTRKVTVVPIDFDVSANRYLSEEFLVKKEREVLHVDLLALESSSHLKKHHDFFVEKIGYLRKAGTKDHAKAVRHWWEQKLATENLSKK